MDKLIGAGSFVRYSEVSFIGRLYHDNYKVTLLQMCLMRQ